MKLRIGTLLLLCGLSQSGLVAQTPTLSCRPMDPSGDTFIYADEQVVGHQVCKIVAVAAPPRNTAQPRPAPVIASPAPQPVSSDPSAAPVPSAPAAATVVGNAPDRVPTEAGMYLESSDRFTKILGQIVEFERTGSLLVSKATFGVKSAKGNAQLLGPHAQTVTGASPQFYFIPPKQEADAGVNAGDLILIRLEEKSQRRQFEVGAEGAGRASKGISLTHQIQLKRSEVKPGVYQVAPAVELRRGEYGLYLARGEGLAPYIYDFSVQ